MSLLRFATQQNVNLLVFHSSFFIAPVSASPIQFVMNEIPIGHVLVLDAEVGGKRLLNGIFARLEVLNAFVLAKEHHRSKRSAETEVVLQEVDMSHAVALLWI